MSAGTLMLFLFTLVFGLLVFMASSEDKRVIKRSFEEIMEITERSARRAFDMLAGVEELDISPAKNIKFDEDIRDDLKTEELAFQTEFDAFDDGGKEIAMRDSDIYEPNSKLDIDVEWKD